ncbi:hypothetical protein ACKLNR_014110 [Fusarium oxysporum f. sp. zingiberi]
MLVIDHDRPDGPQQAGSQPKVNLARPWCVVAGSLAIIWATYGLLASNGVFISYWSSNQLAHMPRSSTTWINGVHLFLSLVLGYPAGLIFDKYGSNLLMTGGGIFYLAGIFAMAESTKFWHFMIAYGVVAGTGCGVSSTIAISVLSHWFKEKRGLATGIVMLGGSLGGVMFPLTLRPLFQKIGWSWSIRALGVFISILVIIGILCIRSGPQIRHTKAPFKMFLNPTFLLMTIGVAAFDFVLFGALGLLPAFGESLNHSHTTSYQLLATLNACSGVGRILAGMLADRIGPLNATISVLSVGLISMLAFWLISNLHVALLYAFAAMFGLSSGGVLSLEPLCIGRLCHESHFGQFYGACFLAVAAITMICIPVGSTLLDTFGQHGFVAFFACVLLISIICFAGSRWLICKGKVDGMVDDGQEIMVEQKRGIRYV